MSVELPVIPDKIPFVSAGRYDAFVFYAHHAHHAVVIGGLNAYPPGGAVRLRTQRLHIAAQVDKRARNAPFPEAPYEHVPGHALGDAAQVYHASRKERFPVFGVYAVRDDLL